MSLKTVICTAALLACFGAAQAQLVIGQTAGYTGTNADGVKETATGAKLYLNSVNAKGGVNGQKIELLSMDDGFVPKKAVENAQKLAENPNVLALFLTRGTPHTEAVLPVLEKHNLPLLAPSTGGMMFHKPVNRLVFNVRSTYQREAERGVAHLASIGLTRIAVVYRDDSFGKDGLEGAQKGLTAAKLTALVQSVDVKTPDYQTVMQKIAKADMQAVMVIAPGKSAADGIKTLRTAGSNAQVVTLSNNASAGFIQDLGDASRGVIVTQVFPSERTDTYPMVKEAKSLAKAQGVAELSPPMLEGFAAAKVLVEGLRRAGPQPTREKLAAALEGIRKFDLGGLEINYSPDDHTGMDFADLSIIDPKGRFRR